MINAVVNVLPYDEGAIEASVAQLISSNKHKSYSLKAKLLCFCNYFLGQPYLNGACGEGKGGQFDQNPLYRLDVFDCVTYVNTVLALWIAADRDHFNHLIRCMNYYDGEVAYAKRFHFMSVDWNQENCRQGFIEDITAQITNEKGQSIACKTHTFINKPNWFLNRSLQDIKQLQILSKQKALDLLNAMHGGANDIKGNYANTMYLPLNKLFFPNGKPNATYFSKIPTPVIVEIVRPGWGLADKIGTDLDISHLGFLFNIDDGLMFYHASTRNKKVQCVPLIEYLSVYLKSSSVKGINIQKINMSFV